MISTLLLSPMAAVPKVLPVCENITARTFMRRMCAIWTATSSLPFVVASESNDELLDGNE